MAHVFPLEDECTIYHVAAVQHALKDALAQHDAIELELSSVEEIDCAALQLLVWCCREAERLGKTVTFSHPSDAVRQLVVLTGFYPYLPIQLDDDTGAQHES